jgi:hypothetical protein
MTGIFVGPLACEETEEGREEGSRERGYLLGWMIRRGKREEGRGKREEGRGKREEGRGKREEGRGKREEGRGTRDLSSPPAFLPPLATLLRLPFLSSFVAGKAVIHSSLSFSFLGLLSLSSLFSPLSSLLSPLYSLSSLLPTPSSFLPPPCLHTKPFPLPLPPYTASQSGDPLVSFFFVPGLEYPFLGVPRDSDFFFSRGITPLKDR